MCIRDSGTDIVQTITTQRHGKALWRFFLMIAIALFMLESYLSRPSPDALKVQQ